MGLEVLGPPEVVARKVDITLPGRERARERERERESTREGGRERDLPVADRELGEVGFEVIGPHPDGQLRHPHHHPLLEGDSGFTVCGSGFRV